ncbi:MULTISPECIES: YedE family putative selenium transporter [unclassified Treponema]|uniref:YedE family putative selenium transporter n=1 Tax=unclassified Treponema TaxID=2638727 RepID=UPI0020A4DE90|nr:MULTISPECIES: YedE family putative selenium transporter [unclassified Treponema]UTC66159.1 YedE-related selenium metabolism membrane protein [Treponema sp. OMZ 789]UTC68888.1 YedE-related selenium metabolism membrane protein [Treponema sp. OMZ 790]UTC71616.1 YedE-related selenium metabolism membrane protein [Treponema sp. OMZ 791]
MKKHLMVIVTGAVIGIAALVLVRFGNPGNMGFCIACFLRDIAGALKLHNAAVVQYMRPEVIGLVIGAFFMAFAKKEFKPRGGSAAFTRFTLGFFVMIGALVFLGCPLRMFLRLGAGDLNAIFGLVGFIAGILIGIFFLNKNFSLNRAYNQSKQEGVIPIIFMIVFFVLLVAFPSVLVFSEKGPGSMKAPIFLALAIGLVVGGLAQKSRMCTVGGIRDAIMLKDFHLLWGSLAVLVTVFIGSLILGKFNPAFAGQPVAHTDGLWNALGMILVGWASVLLGGCPLRQLILTGEGNSDSAVTVVGLIAGAAFAHNFGLASSPKGVTSAGMIAVVVGLILTAFVSIYYSLKNK